MTTTDTIPVQINRIRTLLDWLTDHAQTLPHGMHLQGVGGEYTSLVWWSTDPAAIVARLTEGHGAPTWTHPDDVGEATWQRIPGRPVTLAVYAVYADDGVVR